jgi:hypothetical protein
MRRSFHRLGLAASLGIAMAFILSGAVQAQEPPKEYVAPKVVAKVKYDTTVSFTIPVKEPKVEISRYLGTADVAPIGTCTATFAGREYYGVDGAYLYFEETGVLAAANGDALFYTAVGLGDPEKAAFIITCGAGRFKGATGSGFYTYKALNADKTEYENTFDGFVSTPK